MSKNRVAELIEKLVAPIVEQHDMELVDVEFKKEGKDHFLRIYIDKDGGVNLDDCQAVSEELKNMLDVNEEYDIPYDYLEVSSPGLNRLLKKTKDFKRHSGGKVEVKLFTPVDGKKKFVAVIKDISEDAVLFELEDGQLQEIAMGNMASCRLVVEW